MKIAIIGAGISGLTAAFHLQKHHQVTVFERRDRVGGNILTEEMDGCCVEWGPNGFLDNEPATLDLVHELGLESRIVQARKEAAHRFVWRDGRLRALPSSPPGFLRSDCLPLIQRLRALREPFSRSAPGGDESVHEFATRRLGRGAADVLVDAMVTGIFAGDPQRLSLRSAFPRLHALEAEHGSLIKGAIKTKGGAMKSTLTSFDKGLGVLTEELARRVNVRLGVPLEALPEGFDRIVLTTPAPRAADLLAAEHSELSGLLRQIPTAPVAVVALKIPTPTATSVPDAFGFLVPRGQGLRILGTLYSSSIFNHRAPEGFRLFRVLLGGRRDPEVVEFDDTKILEIVAHDLRQAWGTFPAPHSSQVFRHSLGIAQYEIGHADLLRQIDAARPPWLRLAGSSYRGVALNACVREACEWLPEAPHES